MEIRNWPRAFIKIFRHNAPARAERKLPRDTVGGTLQHDATPAPAPSPLKMPAVSNRTVVEVSEAPSQVGDKLWVGSIANAADPALLAHHNITHLVNATAEHTHPWEGQPTYHGSPLYDQPSERVKPFLAQTIAFISQAQKSGGSVMVFCQHGISRSVTLALAYRMASEHLTLAQAFEQVKAARRDAEPNPGFLQELRQFEFELFGNVTTLEPLTRMDKGAVGDHDAASAFALTVANFIAGGDGRVGKAASDKALADVLQAAKSLGPSALETAVAPMLCKSFSDFGGKAPRDAGAHAFLARLMIELGTLGPEFSKAVTDGLKDVAQSELWMDMAPDVPLAPGFLRALRQAVQEQPPQP